MFFWILPLFWQSLGSHCIRTVYYGVLLLALLTHFLFTYQKHIISFSKQFQAFVHLVEAKTVTKQKFLEEIFKYTKKTAYIFETQKHSLLHSVNLNYNLLGRKCSRFPTTQSRPQISPPEAYLSYLWQ